MKPSAKEEKPEYKAETDECLLPGTDTLSTITAKGMVKFMKLSSKKHGKHKDEDLLEPMTEEENILHQYSENSFLHAGALTPDEILKADRQESGSVSAIESLKKRLASLSGEESESAENGKPDAEVSEQAENIPAVKAQPDENDIPVVPFDPNKTADTIINDILSSMHPTAASSPLEAVPAENNSGEIQRLLQELEHTPAENHPVPPSDRPVPPDKPAEPQPVKDAPFRDTAPSRVQTKPQTDRNPADKKPVVKKSLYDKCMPFLVDENGEEAEENRDPLYRLESVAEILKSDSEKIVEQLSEKYGFTVSAPVSDEPAEEQIKPVENPPAEPEPVKKAEEKKPGVVQSFKPVRKKTHFGKTAEKEPEKKTGKESPTSGKKPDILTISDIDIPDTSFDKPEPAEEFASTVTFTPISDATPDSPSVMVSTQTIPLDFTGELLRAAPDSDTAENEEIQLEKSEFDEYVPSREFTDKQSGKEILSRFGKNRIRSFSALFVSILATLIAAFFKLPFMSGLVLSHTRVCMILVLVPMVAAALFNLKAFCSLKRIFSRKSDPGVNLSLAVIGVLAYSIMGIIKNEIILNMVLLMCIILSFASFGRFCKASADMKSFKQIFSASPKRGIKLISDPAITFAMSKGAVEGDTLIAAAQSTHMINDFMKFSSFGVFLYGKAAFINCASLILALISGFVSAAYFDNAWSGLYCAAAVLCITALPVLFFIDTLPLSNSANTLSHVGAMIAGKAGAEAIEQANAAALSSQDLFPSGTVTLHKMEVLSPNELDDTLIRAASLTEALNSPLSPIFKKIAGTGNITALPDSDTVKYEENLGISGWVDNRLLFIGNRTLMEGHGIKVPDVEVDRKILRQGFFPVYVASQNKACALIIVRYSVDAQISRELRRLTAAGVTLLIKNTDPNLTEEMICDYMGLYADSVKVMSSAGSHIFTNTVTFAKSVSAPAAYKVNPAGLPTILNCACRIKRSNLILSAAYLICAVFGILLIGYISFSGSGNIISDTVLLLYSLITTVITYLVYLIEKP